jgi:transcription initiation factor IIE alpha subunit
MEHNHSLQKYTCPMHPEVKKDKPGNCPKCGSAMKKKKRKKSIQTINIKS